MTELTLEELAELERLSAAASPGPWHREMLELGGRVPMTLGIGGPTRAVCIVSGVAESPAGLRDVAHIVTTKNALPALLAMARELIRLRGQSDNARAYLERTLASCEELHDVPWTNQEVMEFAQQALALLTPPAAPAAEQGGG